MSIENQTIRLDYYTRPDYSYNALFPFVQIERIYNLVLIPTNLLENIDSLNKIKIINKKNNQKYNQSVVFSKNEISILNNKFYAINIAPGFRLDHILEKNDYCLSINNKEISLDLILNSSESPKLLVGNLVLFDNFYNRFNDGDNIELNINNKIIYGKIYQRFNKYNYYIGNKVTTILDIINENNYNILYNLNSNILYNKCYVRSLDTKSNNNKGSLCLNFLDSSKNLVVRCYSNNKIYSKTTDNILSKLYFNDLEKNNYIIEIFNKNNIDNKYLINYNNAITDKLSIDIPEFIDNSTNSSKKGLVSFNKKYLRLI